MQLTAKSQEERKPKCRRCYVDMDKHLLLNLEAVFGVTEKGRKLYSDTEYDWICPKCGLRWEVRPKKKDVSP